MINSDIEIVTPAAEALVSLGEAKTHLGVFHDAEDSRIEMYLATAHERVVSMSGRALVSTSYRLWRDRWPFGRTLHLPLGQLTAVSAVKYYPEGAASPETFASSNYEVIAGDKGAVVLKTGVSWPASLTLRWRRPIAVEFTAGWASAAAVPKVFRQAVLLLLAKMYHNLDGEEAGARIDRAARALVENSYPL